MGIALLALSDLLKNLAFESASTKISPKRHPARIHPIWAQRQGACAAPTAIGTLGAPRTVSLRVLRIQESGQTAPDAGRMVISGRMADVCAELDRLVDLEACHHPS
jgi:hypothetical protein